MTRPRRFVIVSSPRSGTHMLRTALHSHPHLVCQAESFNPDLVASEPYDTSWTTRDVLDRHIFRQRQPRIHAAGFAVHRGGAPLGPWTDLWDHLSDDEELSVIMLHRHDLLRRYLSFEIMRERNRSGDPDFEPARRRLEVETLRQAFRDYEAELAGFRRRFAGHRRFQVSYEELRDQFPRTGLRLQRFLGVPSRAIAPTTKRNPQYRLTDLVTNMPQLREAFGGSRWAWCFQTLSEDRVPTNPSRTDRAVEGTAQLVRAPASIIRRRAPGQPAHRDFLATEVAFYGGREELVVRDFFQDRRGCIFVDIAAGHPVHHSRSYYLEKHLGWLGVAIGVDDRVAPVYAALRPRTRVCSDIPWPTGGASGASDPRVTPPGEAAPSTFGEILADEGVQRIDWLTIGRDIDAAAVLAGLDLRRHRPHLLHVAAPVGDAPPAAWRQAILETLQRADYEPVHRYAAESDLYVRPR